MSTLSHDPNAPPLPDAKRWETVRSLTRDVWSSIAITVMWLAVTVTAIWGPNIVTHDSGGGSASIPSAVVLVLFAYLGTRVVAKYGLGRDDSR